MAVAIPSEWPVASRAGVAVARMMVVDQRGDIQLVCDGLHAGPHFWPDDEPSPPIWDDELDASLAAAPEPIDEPAAAEVDSSLETAPGPEPSQEDPR